jgi:hypothetical protein
MFVRSPRGVLPWLVLDGSIGTDSVVKVNYWTKALHKWLGSCCTQDGQLETRTCTCGGFGVNLSIKGRLGNCNRHAKTPKLAGKLGWL